MNDTVPTTFAVGDRVTRNATPDDGPTGVIREINAKHGRARISFAGLAPIWMKFTDLVLVQEFPALADPVLDLLDEEPPATGNMVKAVRLAAALRGLAQMAEDNPDLFGPLFERTYPFGDLSAYGQNREQLAGFARAALAAGITPRKTTAGTGDYLLGVAIDMGPVVLTAYGRRDEVCERVVVGTRKVTKEVPDPDAVAALPTTTVTETVEDVVWKCGSLLAGGAS